MDKLSEHFFRAEFGCRCGCGYDTVDAELLAVLEDVRNHFGSPVHINSGCRCPGHNKKIGGKPKSQHLLGKAADIDVARAFPGEVYMYLRQQYPDKYGLGLYQNFVHVDVRLRRTRW